MAGALIALAAPVALVFDRAGIAKGAFQGISYGVLPHAALGLVLLTWQLQRDPGRLGRIDGLLFAVLSYIIWFVAVPYYHLL